MKSDKIKVGEVQASYNVAGTKILKYTIEMYHEGLNEHKLLTAPDIHIIQNKVQLQVNKWTDKWNLVESKRALLEEKEASIEEASNRTSEADAAIEEIENLLIHTLSIDDTIDWESLKRNESFSEKLTAKPILERKKAYPEKPIKEEPKFNIIDVLLKSKKEKKIQEFQEKYNGILAVLMLLLSIQNLSEVEKL